ncbi:alpha/beta hydrolase [Aureimonas sp. AU22]|uniref:alpha/beta hydrolase n=1 Tax=Aureimonas sp. AU22 TaxID=1638162 RepID=UPI0007865D7E|nr:alpha/beta hydrolase [Aureimonas sp. AU22]
MTLDPQAAAVLALGAEGEAPPFEAGTAADARRAYRASYLALRGDLEPVASTVEVTIEGPVGPIPMRLHRGIDAPETGAPALLYLHGGGWVIGDLDSHDDICRWFANAGRCLVACPDYRLAPEHRFPAAVEDAAAALGHLHARADDLRIDPHRIAVAGDSAGSNLAAVLALMARDGTVPPLEAQLLLYPNTDARQTADSYRRFAEGYGLTARTMRWFRDQYVRDGADIADWRVSPLLAETLAGAPPAFVVVAGQDILADEGAAYAERLRAAGVPLVLRRRDDQIHGFASAGRHIDAARQTVIEAARSWAALRVSDAN